MQCYLFFSAILFYSLLCWESQRHTDDLHLGGDGNVLLRALVHLKQGKGHLRVRHQQDQGNSHTPTSLPMVSNDVGITGYAAYQPPRRTRYLENYFTEESCPLLKQSLCWMCLRVLYLAHQFFQESFEVWLQFHPNNCKFRLHGKCCLLIQSMLPLASLSSPFQSKQPLLCSCVRSLRHKPCRQPKSGDFRPQRTSTERRHRPPDLLR